MSKDGRKQVERKHPLQEQALSTLHVHELTHDCERARADSERACWMLEPRLPIAPFGSRTT